MFHRRYRRPSFTDPLNWTDYRWEAGPWHAGGPQAPWGARHGPYRSRGRGLAGVILTALAVVIGVRVFSSLRSGNSSWARKGLYAAVLILIAGALSRNRGRWRW